MGVKKISGFNKRADEMMQWGLLNTSSCCYFSNLDHLPWLSSSVKTAQFFQRTDLSPGFIPACSRLTALFRIPLSNCAWLSCPRANMSVDPSLPVSLEVHGCKDFLLLSVLFFACITGLYFIHPCYSTCWFCILQSCQRCLFVLALKCLCNVLPVHSFIFYTQMQIALLYFTY